MVCSITQRCSPNACFGTGAGIARNISSARFGAAPYLLARLTNSRCRRRTQHGVLGSALGGA
jgi:hypothetical protein